MSESTVAIVGSGVAAAAIALHLTKKGHDVVIFEKGPDFPYPHTPQFRERIHYLYRNPAWELPPDLKHVSVSGDYAGDFNFERGMVVGGSATHWHAMALRMNPGDFQTHGMDRRRLALSTTILSPIIAQRVLWVYRHGCG
jgi:choline dehydrogenase-like flavoprotein